MTSPIQPLRVSSILVDGRLRRLREEVVVELMASIREIGLIHPLLVRRPGGHLVPHLVAGWHRLEACQLLGWTEITAEVIEDRLEAELWEIAENLHRSDLTVMQRNLSVGKWIKLRAKKIKQEQRANLVHGGPKSRGRPTETAVTEASRDLGVAKTTALRAVTISTGLTRKAQAAAERLGLENKLRLLEQVAGMPREEQVPMLERAVARAARRTQAKPKLDAATVFWAWFRGLEIDVRQEVRIWLLGVDLEAYFAELDKGDELVRRDQASLH